MNSNISSRINDNLLSMRLIYIGGILDSIQIPNLRRVIIRATRCQVFVNSYELKLTPD